MNKNNKDHDLLAIIDRLETENAYLRKLLCIDPRKKLFPPENHVNVAHPIKNVPLKNNITIDEKIALYQSLFRGRTDVYAKRWENQSGKSGYSPTCGNEWVSPLCNKPKIKCSQCSNKKLLTLTDKVIFEHLAGKQFIGIYPLLQDDKCYFLAIDFDKESWQEDILAFFKICTKNAIPALIERSQSGNGGHIWIFFSVAIAAAIARNLGTKLLALTMQEYPNLTMDSYDRLFPNQDSLPKGGYGNLIALPLQGKRRKAGNSTFLDETLQPANDPWKVLSNITSLTLDNVNNIIKHLDEKITGFQPIFQDLPDNDAAPWERENSKRQYPFIEKAQLPNKVTLVLANQIYINTTTLPAKLINELKKIAAFPNPEFYRAQAMRLSTYNKPRVISCSEQKGQYLCLPRGSRQAIEQLLHYYPIKYQLVDKTNPGKSIHYPFHFILNEDQQLAFEEIMKSRYGILSAVTGFGKTVLAGKVISERKTNTLILVHRQQLLEQWHDKLSMMFDIDKNLIGTLCGGRKKLTGNVDIVMLQSISAQGEVKSFIRDYGQIIVDECHHISAFTFEQVMKEANPNYVLGLTATLKRKDGHHPIITMQCGQVCYHIDNRKQIEKSAYQYIVNIKHTTSYPKKLSQDINISELYNNLLNDNNRNQMICNDVLSAIRKNKTPLLLTERTQHLSILETILKGYVQNIFVLKGGLREKARKKVLNDLFSLPENATSLIIATGKYIGEGFDYPRLDTLFLALPISWQGTLQQYVGRLHRDHKNKNVITVYDYVDINVPMLMRMYQKRYKKYQSMGYQIEEYNDTEIT